MVDDVEESGFEDLFVLHLHEVEVEDLAAQVGVDALLDDCGFRFGKIERLGLREDREMNCGENWRQFFG